MTHKDRFELHQIVTVQPQGNEQKANSQVSTYFDGFVLWQKPCGGKGIYILLCLNSQDAKTALKWFTSTMAIGYHASFNASCVLLQERFL